MSARMYFAGGLARYTFVRRPASLLPLVLLCAPLLAATAGAQSPDPPGAPGVTPGATIRSFDVEDHGGPLRRAAPAGGESG
jgi:hypothetical protein